MVGVAYGGGLTDFGTADHAHSERFPRRRHGRCCPPFHASSRGHIHAFSLGHRVHTAEHLASAMFYLGAGRVEIPRAKLFAANGNQMRTPLAQCVIHPCASTPEKTWPADRFIEAASYVEKSLELEPVFISGPDEDLSPFRRWRTLSAAPLAEIKSLISSASLFIGNDSGPAHMAAAFGIPSVVIFGASDPVTWAPWRTQAEVLTGRNGTTSIGVHEAIEAFDRLRVRA